MRFNTRIEGYVGKGYKSKSERRARRQYRINVTRRRNRKIPKWVSQNGGAECGGCGVWSGRGRDECARCHRAFDERTFRVKAERRRGPVGVMV